MPTERGDDTVHDTAFPVAAPEDLKIVSHVHSPDKELLDPELAKQVQACKKRPIWGLSRFLVGHLSFPCA